MKYAPSQEVVLTRDIPDKGLKKGDVATVVDHHPVPSGEDGYSLEVFNALGDTIAVITAPESLIEPLKEDEVFSVRSLATSDQGDFYLYHYTTPEGLRKIVEEAKIWASRIFFLNDAEEWYVGMKLFEDRLKRREASHPIFGHYLLAVQSAMIGEERGGLAPEKNLAMHVCSFSKNGDLLSQWRAYCPKGGFALGFRKSKLERLAADQGFTFERCLYEPEDQIRMIDAVLDRIGREAMTVDQTQYARIINTFNWEMWRTAAIMKHWGFHEELEWRFLSTLKYTGTSEELGFHANEGVIIPHRVINLENAELWADVSVFVGPNPHKEKSVHVVRDFLWRKRQVLAARIKPSSIPYRHP